MPDPGTRAAGSAAPVPADAPLLRVRGLAKAHGRGAGAVTALRDVDLDVEAGTVVAVTGRSGAGKTTLLSCLGGLERPDAGTVLLDGLEVTALDEAGLTALRRDVVAHVFQTFGLVDVLTAAENVGLPLRLRHTPGPERDARTAELLDLVGLAPHALQRPGELSGGQQQRVAVARALANRPRLLLADEPTGQLDAATGAQIMHLLRRAVRVEGATALVATHDPALLRVADRVVRLVDGHLVSD